MVTPTPILARLVRGLSLGLVVVLLSTPSARADSYDAQIRALKQQISAQQTQLDSTHGQAETLAAQIGALNAKIDRTASQIRLAQVEYDKTTVDLEQAQQKLSERKEVLATIIRQMYMDGNRSALEILASSKNLSDYFDQLAYQEKIQDQVQSAMQDIQKTGERLSEVQTQQRKIMQDQGSLQFALNQQRSDAAALLEQTQGQESVYQAQIATAKQQKAQLEAAQAAELARVTRKASSGGNYAGVSTYPAKWNNAPKDSLVDDWGFYNRECTSWAAFRRAALGRPIPAWGRMGYADAKTWPNWARSAGYRVDSQPEVGAVAVYTGGQYGHVSIVEKINGNTVTTSSYNIGFTGNYSVDDWQAASLVYIH